MPSPGEEVPLRTSHKVAPGSGSAWRRRGDGRVRSDGRPELAREVLGGTGG